MIKNPVLIAATFSGFIMIHLMLPPFGPRLPIAASPLSGLRGGDSLVMIVLQCSIGASVVRGSPFDRSIIGDVETLAFAPRHRGMPLAPKVAGLNPGPATTTARAGR